MGGTHFERVGGKLYRSAYQNLPGLVWYQNLGRQLPCQWQGLSFSAGMEADSLGPVYPGGGF